MQLQWSKNAVHDLTNIRKFIHRKNPEVAKEVAIKIAALAETLIQHPAKGRNGRLPKTRELIVPELPYIIVYRAKKEQIEILRVIHTSIKWPT
jgi:toxin ParE1/3/4